MPEYRYYHPIEVRYGDLDPQWHVNNAKYLTYIEQARVSYVGHVGLWEGTSFLDIGFILAETRVTFLTPITFHQPIRVGVRVSRLGKKSLSMEYILEDSQTGQEMANASATLVTYDYRTKQTIPIPTHWREKICAFEGIDPKDCAPDASYLK
jgi:acyl-CoA thioester hydrolase